jgi:glycosidase
MIRKIALLLLALLLSIATCEAATHGDSTIQRVAPPNWWTGFRESALQLMIYGEGIAAFTPAIDHAGVRLTKVDRVKSPNYLFLYLEIGEDVQPGSFNIRFESDGETLVHSYPLLARHPDPARHAKGFGPQDAIYLITPDRFANGDPANDTVAGMGDEADRGNPGGRHGGDIQGIIDALPYIADMGFTAIWLNPLLENRMPEYSYHGYSTTDFYRVDPLYGRNELYLELVSTARKQGIGVIMDMIVNHIGSGHWWMDDLPTGDWLNFQQEPVITSHEHITDQDPYASEYDKRMFSDGWFVFTMPDLNQRNPLLADYLTQNALWWIEYLGLAGIRMDTYPYPDKHYMTEWTRRVMLEYPDFKVVGEEWTANAAAVAYWQAGNKNRDGYISYLSSLMDFPLQENMRLALVTEDGAKLDDGSQAGLMKLYLALANDFLYPSPNDLVIFPDNHDMNRIFEQVGHDYDLFRMALAYVLTMRGAPQIYYGTEILMKHPGSEAHGDLRADFPGGWAGDTVSAYTGKGLSEQEREAQAFVRTLLHWRKDRAVVHNGKTTHFRPEDGTYVYFRYDDSDTVMVALNKNHQTVELELTRFAERLQGYDRATDVVSGEQHTLGDSISLPARSVTVLDLD